MIRKRKIPNKVAAIIFAIYVALWVPLFIPNTFPNVPELIAGIPAFLLWYWVLLAFGWLFFSYWILTS
jgi:uncharacterized membrane protein YccC